MNKQVDEEILKAREMIKERIANGEEMTKKWSYILVCDTVEQVDTLMKEDHLMEASKNGTLTRDELQELCDVVFGEEKFYSRLIFLTMIKNNKTVSSLDEDEEKELNMLNEKREKLNSNKR